MLSIIISSYNSRFFNALEQNIKDTCGIIYELIRVENPGTMNINQAYNLGIKQSKYEYLLFIHEDVLFETPEWGRILINHFKSSNDIGLIGLAGSTFKPKAPSGWWIDDSFREIYIKQYDGKRFVEDFTTISHEQDYAEVLTLDGVLLATKKSLGLRFDESLLGFHNYDIAISLLARNLKLKSIVTFKIIVSHFSVGNYGKPWIRSVHNFYKSHGHLLPQSIHPVINAGEIERSRYFSFFKILMQNQEYKLCRYYAIEVIRHYPLNRLGYSMLFKLFYLKLRSMINF